MGEALDRVKSKRKATIERDAIKTDMPGFVLRYAFPRGHGYSRCSFAFFFSPSHDVRVLIL